MDCRCAVRTTYIQVWYLQQFAGLRHRNLVTDRTMRKLFLRALNCEPRLQAATQVRDLNGMTWKLVAAGSARATPQSQERQNSSRLPGLRRKELFVPYTAHAHLGNLFPETALGSPLGCIAGVLSLVCSNSPGLSVPVRSSIKWHNCSPIKAPITCNISDARAELINNARKWGAESVISGNPH